MAKGNLLTGSAETRGKEIFRRGYKEGYIRVSDCGNYVEGLASDGVWVKLGYYEEGSPTRNTYIELAECPNRADW